MEFRGLEKILWELFDNFEERVLEVFSICKSLENLEWENQRMDEQELYRNE